MKIKARLHYFTILFLVGLAGGNAYATVFPEKDTILDPKIIIKDSPIVAAMDSLLELTFYDGYSIQPDSAFASIYNYEPDFIPVFPDSVLKARLDSMNLHTPIELAFNRTVKTYINLYANRKRELTSKMLGLSHVYFPLFEEVLDKYDMPLELKYLAIVESALNPRAGSRAGAKGLWQFMYGTGKVYGLKVSSYVDDRYDVLKSTDAACRHLKDLYDIYGNWSLAMAAYNSGPGNVNKAIRRAGNVKSYWAVWPFLPRETRGYVPAFIAVTYVMNHAAEHNLYPIEPPMIFYEFDTVHVKNVLTFDQLHEMLDIPMDEIKFLNPQYKKGVIPAIGNKEFVLHLPKEHVGNYISNESAVYLYKTKKGLERDKLIAEIKRAKDRNIHIVRSGENLGLIAKKYHVYVSQIKRWNNLRSSMIYPGQRLVIYGTP